MVEGTYPLLTSAHIPQWRGGAKMVVVATKVVVAINRVVGTKVLVGMTRVVGT
jgi:hypothetical protein